MARTGDGMARDDAMAASLYRRAAERGSGPAAVQLARALREGRGVARDPVEAWEWFSLALGFGSDPALAEERARLEPLVPASARVAAEERAARRLAAARPQPLRPPPASGPQGLPPPPVRR